MIHFVLSHKYCFSIGTMFLMLLSCSIFWLLLSRCFKDPDFSQMDCKSMEIGYWARTNTPRELSTRRFELSCPSIINSLKRKFNVAKVSGLSVPFYCHTKILLSDGNTWGVDAISKDTFMFWLENNKYALCKIILKDTSFYDELLKLCLENEKKIYPAATLNNITLCSGDCTSLLDIENIQFNCNKKQGSVVGCE